MTQLLMTYDEALKELRYTSKTTLHNLIKKGLIRKLGRRIVSQSVIDYANGRNACQSKEEQDSPCLKDEGSGIAASQVKIRCRSDAALESRLRKSLKSKPG